MSWHYDDDRNELHAAERDEERSARRRLTELDRATACGHEGLRNASGNCTACGDSADYDRPEG